MSEESAIHRIAVLLLEPVVGFDATIPPLLFGQAVDDAGRSLYEVETVGLGPSPLQTTTAYQITPSADVSALATADTVIVPGTKLASCRIDGTIPDDLREALTLIRPRARVVSICTGAFVLAAGGYLDGRRATTHWRYADDFRRLYPRVDLDESVLFVDDGDVLSSAGLAAGIDLCLHIIRRDHGTAVANAVARHCVVPPWREGGQAQFIERQVPGVGGPTTAATREWAVHHLDQNLSVSALARRAQMSQRTFSRRFQEETGVSPGVWVRERRLDLARELLEAGELSIDVIAARSGLGSADTLRHHLRRHLGMAPSAYRKVFVGR
ncbi:GlxA family transcriptional regulator [Gordonia otitidis]|uniref:AraC family transcriptional regulator n=1 Tax=Gordonia otitidis (strain DSM 44809 / CCUG 52243 / JCM 12355 / NBRC 100426 / IFM 10032) TaxID=1108044 RepID=H5TPK6_GORO1|nr:helix-turn-helix domain-containing protein [Gordonia otitidis]GAB35414.1 putative AraC family transcriptional regulator [Gordonia otitidis NBRC 100426]